MRIFTVFKIRLLATFAATRASFTLLLLLTGCLPCIQEQHKASLLSPPSLESTTQRNLESGYFTCGDWPQDRWWEIFSSPQLNELMQEALVANPSIQAIQQKVEIANQSAILARSKLFPWVSLDFVYTWEYLSKNGLYKAFNPKLPLNANLYDLDLTLNYELDLWGKNKEMFQAAIGRQLAEEAEKAQVNLMITTAVAQAFVTVKINQQRKNFISQLVGIRKDIYDLQNLLHAKALLSKLLVYSSEENYYDALKMLTGVEEELAISKHLLNILVGRGPDAPLDIGEEPLPPIDIISIPSNLSLDLLARRPDLMAQIWRVEAWAHEINAAKTEYYPDVNLKAFLGFESINADTLLRTSSGTAGIIPAIHLPLFTAGAIQANIDAKRAHFNEAVFEYNQILLLSAQEVVDRLVSVESLFKQKRDQDLLMKKIEARYSLTRLLYEKGLDDLVTVDYLKEELIRQELESVNLTYAQNISMLRLIKALGGGYQSPYIPLAALEGECE